MYQRQSNNKYLVKDDVCIIYLNSEKYKGLMSLIDVDKMDDVLKYSWSSYYAGNKNPAFYARARIEDNLVLLHKYLLPHPTLFVDHINRQTLDNRLCNLRLATHQQNIGNREGGSIHLMKSGRYRARLARKHLGCFGTKEEAEVAYQKAHLEKHGVFSPYHPSNEV